MNKIRRQLTLFIPQNDAGIIEQVRQAFNPIQRALINSHVTLCREDEIENIEQVITNLHQLTYTTLEIAFGKATRFDNGKGVLLVAKAGHVEFNLLRTQILTAINDSPRKQEPHITLMHARNATCTDEIFEQIKNITFPEKLTFKKISLIEQNNGEQWQILKEFELQKR